MSTPTSSLNHSGKAQANIATLNIRDPMANLRLDHYDMEIDPRLRDTPSAGSYTQQPRPPSAPSQIPIAPLPSRSPAAAQQYQPIQSGSPQNYYLPQSPQSGGNATDNDAANGPHDGNGDEGPTDPKRSRACEACRGLKVKCEPAPNNQDLPCKRCAKANRNCVVTQPSRKRQKKTDSRVAELEKKIDALTATLAQKSGPNTGHHEGVLNTEVRSKSCNNAKELFKCAICIGPKLLGHSAHYAQ
jgi:Fungal Zn(2)-Cys(6) binuclear cluster domain